MRYPGCHPDKHRSERGTEIAQLFAGKLGQSQRKVEVLGVLEAPESACPTLSDPVPPTHQGPLLVHDLIQVTQERSPVTPLGPVE